MKKRPASPLTNDNVDPTLRTCCGLPTNRQRRSVLALLTGLLAPLPGNTLLAKQAAADAQQVVYDLTRLPPGRWEMIEWQGKQVWIVHRTPAMVAALKKSEPDLEDPSSEHSMQPDYVSSETRSIQPEYFVCIGICTHMGCPLIPKILNETGSALGESWNGGFMCPCHVSRYDLAGRVYKNMPAPLNLEIPPHAYLDETHLIIGLDSNAS